VLLDKNHPLRIDIILPEYRPAARLVRNLRAGVRNARAFVDVAGLPEQLQSPYLIDGR